MNTISTQTKKVALYARVSTEEQKEGQTIDSQVSELERFAKQQGWEVAGVYKDEGWSGPILARPELDRLRDDARKGLFSVVLVNDVDRLSRDVTHLGIIKRDLERHGIQVVFTKLPAEKSPANNLMINILGSFAEFERELIADRTRRGRRHKVEVRQQFIGSRSPYGFRYILKDLSQGEEGHLEVAPEEASIVRQMYQWVDTEGLSVRRVIDRLNMMKIPPRKGGKKWAKSSVLRILRSEVYAGVWHYNKHESCEPMTSNNKEKYRRLAKSSNRLRNRDEWLPVTLSQNLWIIERNQWERVQKQLTSNIPFSPRNSKHQYLLKGLVWCGECGARYVGDPNHGRFYYRCLARCKKLPSICEGDLDLAVWTAVEEAILNPSLIANQLEELQKKRGIYMQDVGLKTSEVDQALSQLEKEEGRILEAYRLGVIDAAQLARELEQLNSRREGLQKRKVEIPIKDNIPNLPSIRRALFSYCQLVAQGLKSLSFEGKQTFLRLIVNRIVFEGNRVGIKGVLPIDQAKESGNENPNNDLPISPYRTATTGVYLNGRSTVMPVHFELSRLLPQKPLPLRKQLDPFSVRNLVEQNPQASLKELCELIHYETGIVLSTTSLCRILLRLDLPYKIRQQLVEGESEEKIAA